VLTQRRARQLARLAARERDDGSRRWRARRAWARLAEAGDAGDQVAAEAVWQAWLTSTDDERWELLARWREPAALAEAACDAAVADGGAAAGADHRSVAAFCARHRLAPADPARRAVFYLLTGQADQLRAADTDGSALALGYAAADPAQRARIRVAMAAAGSPEPARMIVQSVRQQQTELTGDEASYLASQLAGRRDWAGLWRLVQGLPVLDAVTAMRHFRDGWQPASARECALFSQLVRADRSQLSRARRTLGAMRAPDGTPMSGTRIAAAHLSPVAFGNGALPADGRQLPVVTRKASNKREYEVAVFDLPGIGTSAAGDTAQPATGQRYSIMRPGDPQFAFVGGSLLAKAGPSARADVRGALSWYENGQLRWLPRLDTGGYAPYIYKIAPGFTAAGRFVVLGQRHLAFYERDGTLLGTRPLQDETWLSVTGSAQQIAAQPGGLLAVTGRSGLAVFTASDVQKASLAATAPLPDGAWTQVRFCGPGRMVTVTNPGSDQSCEVRLWQLDGERLECQATAWMQSARDPVVIPGMGLIAIWSIGGLRFLDPGSLEDTAPPEGISRHVTGLWNTPGLDRCALVGRNFIEVHDGVHPVAAIADRPPGRWVPGDLTCVSSIMRAPAPDEVTCPLLEVLRACLEYRFDSEVGLGAEARLSAGDDDVAL
jgi:hypothetical protein